MNTINFKYVAGIDVSKSTIDVTLIDKNISLKVHKQFKNDDKGFKAMCSWIKKNKVKLDDVLFCAEKTGLYDMKMSKYLSQNNYKFWLEDGIRISKSEGLKRGKSDKVDSERIARYAIRFQDNIRLFELHDEIYEKLDLLSSSRERLLKAATSLETALNETSGIIDSKFQKELETLLRSPIKHLKTSINKVEKKTSSLIKSDDSINKKYKIASSVRGVGEQTAIYLLSVTKGFTKINTSRKCSCFGGMAPFEYSSGTSVRGRTRISKMGDKKLKKLLHMGAVSILAQKKGEEYDYYCRKVAEGKHKMKVINALRNKILARVFACIRDNREYNVDYKRA